MPFNHKKIFFITTQPTDLDLSDTEKRAFYFLSLYRPDTGDIHGTAIKKASLCRLAFSNLTAITLKNRAFNQFRRN
ncbi:hypothetical protein DAQ1742_02216 [Dickeya aquatica]|uniref:Uncharacterized protein n=1 Tax=Dickeya aquatica TaxID=1401087 RepID=A0A375AAI5_9GAMM|nr:hypothetical protein DAQ1742_02216 [Dickeya aquatica]